MKEYYQKQIKTLSYDNFNGSKISEEIYLLSACVVMDIVWTQNLNPRKTFFN